MGLDYLHLIDRFTGADIVQVFDVLGRIQFTQENASLNSKLSTLNLKSGVYMLRLITPEKVRTQKLTVH